MAPGDANEGIARGITLFVDCDRPSANSVSGYFQPKIHRQCKQKQNFIAGRQFETPNKGIGMASNRYFAD